MGVIFIQRVALCAATHYNTLVCCSEICVLQCVTVCRSVLQCVAGCCSALQ